MTAIALLSVAPVREGRMAADVADAVAALEAFDVTYETNPMGTVIEAEDAATLFAAARAAHEAVDADRVSTLLKVDDKRTREGTAAGKVAAVERELGRPARGAATAEDENEDEDADQGVGADVDRDAEGNADRDAEGDPAGGSGSVEGN